MSVRPALAKLNHSDVRQRRRAVRHLFELDDPEALDGFVRLLDDPDPWFREKALEAIDRWAASKDLAIIERLAGAPEDSRRLLAARISGRAGRAGQAILEGLSGDGDQSIRLAAWQARMKDDGAAIEAALSSDDRAIRKLAAQRLAIVGSADEETILRLLGDESQAVRTCGIILVEANDSTLGPDILDRLSELAHSASGETKARLAAILSRSNPADIGEWIGDQDTAFVNRFSKTLREADWPSIEGLPKSLEANASQSLLERLLRGERAPEAAQLREKLLTDESRSAEMRSRLIEDLIGRPVPESTLEIIQSLAEAPDEMLAASANNLLAEQ